MDQTKMNCIECVRPSLIAFILGGSVTFGFAMGAETPQSKSSSGTLAKSNAVASAVDLDGRAIDPFANSDAKAIVLIFVSTDCPIANRYAPEIQRLDAPYRPQKVAFWLVYADPTEGPQKVRKHLKEYRHQTPALRDPHHRLVDLSGAKKTPDAAVFAPGKKRVYLGRIDDRYTDYGKSRNSASQHNLSDAIDAVLAGQPVKVAATETIGCYIPDPE